MLGTAAMTRQAPWPKVKAAAAIFFYACCAVAALGFADFALVLRGPDGVRQLYALSRLPERGLDQSFSSPAQLRGSLHSDRPRRTPSGAASAIWYAWIEEERRSGRSSYTVILCAKGEDDELQLRQGSRTARLELFADSEHIALLKNQPLESLPLDRVALDFGAIRRESVIPQPMQELCAGKFRHGRSLSYREASIPAGAAVTVLGCSRDGVVHSCGTPPGAISVRELRPVLRAYANETLKSIRGAAALVGLCLSLLAAALFKLKGGGAT